MSRRVLIRRRAPHWASELACVVSTNKVQFRIEKAFIKRRIVSNKLAALDKVCKLIHYLAKQLARCA